MKADVERARDFLERVVYLRGRAEARRKRARQLGRLDEDCGEVVATYRAELMEDAVRMVAAEREALRLIDGLSDDRCKELLELRYVAGESWERIAAKMYYSVRYVYMLHTKALEQLGEVMTGRSGDRQERKAAD